MAETQDLIADAIKVLKKNNQKTYTSPAGDLYPHQWLWDSCFIAIGLRHVNVLRAQKELRSLLRGQWYNGMIPNMIFRNIGVYARDAAIWRSQLSPLAPDNTQTSGITQPPMLAEAVVRVGEAMHAAERRTWYAQMLPALVAYHSWLFRERDPDNTGLVAQLHPYETGLDNTPPWIDQLHKYHRPLWSKVITKLHADRLINLIRRDTRHVTPGQRMDTMDAVLFYDLIRFLRKHRYNSGKLLHTSRLVIQDVTFNSIFIRANQHLEDIAAYINEPLPPELSENIARSRQSFEQLWDTYSSTYCSRNYKTKKLIRTPSIGTLMPLYSGVVSKARAVQLVKLLHRKDFFDSTFPIASVPLGAKEFQSTRYWQGPTWINTNWLIADGLERYGFTTEASKIRESSIELVRQSGFYEYFSPIDGSPAGAADFSWTAALILDMLSS